MGYTMKAKVQLDSNYASDILKVELPWFPNDFR